MLVSTAEAAILVGKSKTTIKRWARSQFSDSSSRPFIKRQPMPLGGYKYMIDKEHLLQSFPPIQTDQEAQIDNENGKLIMDMLKEQLEEKNRLIERYERLIDHQEAFIQSLKVKTH